MINNVVVYICVNIRLYKYLIYYMKSTRYVADIWGYRLTF